MLPAMAENRKDLLTPSLWADNMRMSPPDLHVWGANLDDVALGRVAGDLSIICSGKKVYDRSAAYLPGYPI
jgi:hypothetical protein